MANFVPYDKTVHRDHFLKLNVEHLNWFVEEAFTRHKIDTAALTGPPTVGEYVETYLDDFTSIRPPKGIIYMVETEGNVVGMGGGIKRARGRSWRNQTYVYSSEISGAWSWKKVVKETDRESQRVWIF